VGEVLQFATQVEIKTETVQCKFCHGEIDADARFCKHCGNKVAKQQKETKKKYAPKSKHTKVPLRTSEEIAMMQKVLATPTKNNDSKKKLAHRNFTLFTLGISIGIRSSDLTILKPSHFFTKDWTPRKTAYVIEVKTGKGLEFDLNTELTTMLYGYVKRWNIGYNDYFAYSQKPRKTGEYAGEFILTPNGWNNIIIKAAEDLGWNGTLYGGHSVRKTFAYQFYKNANTISQENGYRALSILCKRLNHSSEAITLCYIGIEKEEVCKICNLTTAQYNYAYNEALKFEFSDKDNDM